MNIDKHCNQLRPLNEYTNRIPSSRPGKRLNRTTLWRWALKGCRGIKLETVLAGSGRYTTDAWVASFMAGLSEGSTDKSRSKASRKALQREQQRIMGRFGLGADGRPTGTSDMEPGGDSEREAG